MLKSILRLDKISFKNFSTKMEIFKIVLDPFCYPAFEPKDENTPAAVEFDKEEFTVRVNEFYVTYKDTKLIDGYAPFWKHLFIENFTTAKTGTAEITPENESLLKTGYEARRDNELAVLCRWFDKTQFTPQVAKYLDIILYSNEQVQEENKAMGTEDPNKHIDYDYVS